MCMSACIHAREWCVLSTFIKFSCSAKRFSLYRSCPVVVVLVAAAAVVVVVVVAVVVAVVVVAVVAVVVVVVVVVVSICLTSF